MTQQQTSGTHRIMKKERGKKSILLMPGMKVEPSTIRLTDIKTITSGYVEDTVPKNLKFNWEI